MARTSRREFLDDAFFAATMTAIAATLPAEAAFAAAPRRRVGPNDRVRIACIGVRSRGMSHVGGYLDLPDVDVVAVCDVDLNIVGPAVAAIEKQTGKKPKVYQDLRKVFEDKDIDAVSMALPIHWHSLAAYWAMQSGKDVYVEKPCSHNVSEGRRLVEAMARFGRVCQVGTQSRSSKAVRGGIQHVHDGKIGKVSLARGLCYKRRDSIGIKADASAPENVDYDLWLGAAPKRPFNPNRFHYNWHWHWDYGTGDLGNQGIHQMDIARWSLGKDRLPGRALSLGGRFGYVDQGETPNTLVSLFEYDDCRLIFEVRGLPTDKVKGVDIGDIVYGESGYVVFSSNYGLAVAFHPDGSEAARFTGGGDHFANFVAAVKSRKASDLNAPVVEGHLSSALCHIGNVSYKLGREIAPGQTPRSRFDELPEAAETVAHFREHLAARGADLSATAWRLGKPLAIDARRETFRKDRDANALLTRDYRAGFVLPSKV